MIATMTSLATAASRRFGGKTALTMIDSGEGVTFAQIDARAGRYAAGLAAAGVARGDCVALHLPNGIDWIVVYHAIARLGAVVVPVNILLSPDEVAYITEDSGAVAIALPTDRAADIAAARAPDACSILTIAHGEGSANGTVPAARLLESAISLDPVDVDPDDLFTIGYTSGTTGRPKGATQTHRALVYNLAMTSTMHVRGPHDRVLSALPFPHVYGNIVLNSAFLTGLSVFSASRFDPGECLRVIGESQITLFEGVPTMYYQILASDRLDGADLASLTRCTVGGQTMPTAYHEQVEQRFGCRLLELWGMTELAGLGVTHSPYWPRHVGSIGLPFPQTEVRIADLDDFSRDAETGSAGELCVRGPCVTRGYWNKPEASAEAIDSEGWLKTGDIATCDAEGYLRIVDRRKDMIITAGYNIYPAELEQAIAAHPDVAMVAVGSVPDEEKGELAKAYIVLRDGAVADSKAIVDYCRTRLAPYKLPRHIAFVDDLPKTSTGKIMRRALADI
jgi:long-chain acyl-CoA synthetase